MLNNYRKAIYNLAQTTGLTVYDYWPIDRELPYCITQNVQVIDDNAKNAEYGEYIFDIHIFDKSIGKTNVIGYAELIRQNLNSLELDDVDRRASYLVVEDKEPNINHAIVSVRFKR